jgi:hypothetical protein
MKCRIAIISALMLITTMSSVVAATASPRQLFCTISTVSNFKDNNFGENKRALDSRFKELATRVFIVDHMTGEISGKLISNKSLQIQLIDNGNKDGQSVKILSKVKPAYAATGYMHAIYLEILLYSDDNEKPFILVAEGNVLTGTCE